MKREDFMITQIQFLNQRTNEIKSIGPFKFIQINRDTMMACPPEGVGQEGLEVVARFDRFFALWFMTGSEEGFESIDIVIEGREEQEEDTIETLGGYTIESETVERKLVKHLTKLSAKI